MLLMRHSFFLRSVKIASDGVKTDTLIAVWFSGEFCNRRLDKTIQFLLSGFTDKRIIALERIGDEASSVEKLDDAVAAYSTALFLGPSTPNSLLTKWASTMLLRDSTNEALDVATKVCFT